MADINLVYNSPQDKLLIMLLERISTLEDVINKQNNLLSELTSMHTSDVFTVYLSGKCSHVGYEELTKVQDEIVAIINEYVPCHSIHAHFHSGRTNASLVLHTKEKHMLRTVETLLTEKLSGVVHLNLWSMKSPMEVVKHTRMFHNYTEKLL